MTARPVSIGTQIKQLAGLLDTTDLTDWEADFVASVNLRSKGGAETRALTTKQVETIESIYEKNFA